MVQRTLNLFNDDICIKLSKLQQFVSERVTTLLLGEAGGPPLIRTLSRSRQAAQQPGLNGWVYFDISFQDTAVKITLAYDWSMK